MAQDWRRNASCARAELDSDAWHPESGVPDPVVLRVCKRCPVWKACLNWALEHDEAGVWGGTTHRMRSRMLTKAAAA